MRYLRKLSLDYKSVIMMLQIIALMSPMGIYSLMPAAGTVWNLFAYMMSAVVMVQLLCLWRRMNRNTVIFFAFFGAVILITMIQKGNLLQSVSQYKYIFVWIALFYVYADSIKTFLKCLRIYLCVLVLINFIAIIMYPNGMYISDLHEFEYNWILGYKNSLQEYILPLFILTLFKLNDNKRDPVSWGVLIVCIAESLMGRAVTLTLVLLLSLALYIMSVWAARIRLNPYAAAGAIAVVNVIFISGSFLSYSYVNSFLSDVLDKGSDLNGRVQIWNSIIREVNRSPILGYGVLTTAKRMRLTGIEHAHNAVLEILYQGGIFWLVMFAALCLYLCRRLKNFTGSKAGTVMVIFLFAALAFGVFEPLTHKNDGIIWLLFALCADMQVLADEPAADAPDAVRPDRKAYCTL